MRNIQAQKTEVLFHLKTAKLLCFVPLASALKDEAQGARRAKTGMYTLVHEDFEHCVTQ